VITYESGEHQTVTDYIMEKRKHRMIHDVKAIPSEACAPQHKLLVAVLKLQAFTTRKRPWYAPRIKVWKLKEVEVQTKFLQSVMAGVTNRMADDVNRSWNGLKSCLLEAAHNACGVSKGPPRHTRTWWLWDELEEVIETKRQCYKKWKKSKKRSDRAAYKAAKRKAKTEMAKAKETEAENLCYSGRSRCEERPISHGESAEGKEQGGGW
jgi:hypothetical protein